MNKIERAALKGVRESLAAVRSHQSDDNWETYGKRLKERVRSALNMLDSLLELPADEEKQNDNNEPLTLN